MRNTLKLKTLLSKNMTGCHCLKIIWMYRGWQRLPNHYYISNYLPLNLRSDIQWIASMSLETYILIAYKHTFWVKPSKIQCCPKKVKKFNESSFAWNEKKSKCYQNFLSPLSHPHKYAIYLDAVGLRHFDHVF